MVDLGQAGLHLIHSIPSWVLMQYMDIVLPASVLLSLVVPLSLVGSIIELRRKV